MSTRATAFPSVTCGPLYRIVTRPRVVRPRFHRKWDWNFVRKFRFGANFESRMSGGLCEPPARLQKLTTRFCLRALDQYDKILHFKSHKSKNNIVRICVHFHFIVLKMGRVVFFFEFQSCVNYFRFYVIGDFPELVFWFLFYGIVSDVYVVCMAFVDSLYCRMFILLFNRAFFLSCA